jgi:hypothetical protein
MATPPTPPPHGATRASGRTRWSLATKGAIAATLALAAVLASMKFGARADALRADPASTTLHTVVPLPAARTPDSAAKP